MSIVNSNFGIGIHLKKKNKNEKKALNQFVEVSNFQFIARISFYGTPKPTSVRS